MRLDAKLADVCQRCLLRRAGVAKQRARRTDGQRRVRGAERREVLCAELPGQRLRRGGRVEVPRGKRAGGGASPHGGCRGVIAVQQLGGLDPLDRGEHLVVADVDQRDPPGGEVEPRDARAPPAVDERRQQAVALRLEQVGVGQRARRDDPGHLAFDRALASRGIADLLDDDRALAFLHQSREMRIDRVERDARHGDRRTRGLAARSQRDVEEA